LIVEVRVTDANDLGRDTLKQLLWRHHIGQKALVYDFVNSVEGVHYLRDVD